MNVSMTLRLTHMPTVQTLREHFSVPVVMVTVAMADHVQVLSNDEVCSSFGFFFR